MKDIIVNSQFADIYLHREGGVGIEAKPFKLQQVDTMTDNGELLPVATFKETVEQDGRRIYKAELTEEAADFLRECGAKLESTEVVIDADGVEIVDIEPAQEPKTTVSLKTILLGAAAIVVAGKLLK